MFFIYSGDIKKGFCFFWKLSDLLNIKVFPCKDEADCGIQWQTMIESISFIYHYLHLVSAA